MSTDVIRTHYYHTFFFPASVNTQVALDGWQRHYNTHRAILDVLA